MSTAPTRPDPDALLAQLRADETRAARGKLRIYFGASAGVGKTWAMLSAAQRERQAGRDVAIGVVETHGRAETAALLAELEQIPPCQLAHRGHTLPEFDLDAALARRPALLLVDELAHSNAPGSRHAKRWQDVQELLDAGIDVWTTLNVQHLESLNGTVGAITGVRVHETVPDAVLDGAQEVLLIDVTPDELLRRLSAGKVYVPRQAERAVQNFFRKGNLIALREIALRRTAEHVEGDVREWRVEQSAGTGGAAPPAWNTSGAILAAVNAGEDAAQTVRRAAQMASQLNVNWHVVHVETQRLRRQSAAQQQQRHERVLAVLKLAEELGAQTAVLSGDDVAETLAAEAQRLNCATVVLGHPRAGAFWRRGLGARGGVARMLARCAPALDVVSVGEAPSTRRLSLPRAALAGASLAASNWPGHVWALGASVLISLLAWPLAGWLESTNIVMLYLLGVVGVALRFGRGPAALAALLNVAAFDFFFVKPLMSFSVSDVQYLLTFAGMLGVGLLVGQLTAGLRFAAEVSSAREQRARSLFELTRELSAALQGEQIAQMGAGAVEQFFGGPACVLAANAQDRLALPATLPEGLDASVADWVFAHGQSAGLGTATLAAQRWHYVPLRAPMRVRGVLALAPANPQALLVPEQARQLDAFARQIAIALERVHYVEVAQQAMVEIESERLRGALLGAISHDVRTPLTALIGLAESLQALPPGPHGEAARAIERQARALHALVGNLLDMVRIEGGAVNLRRAWQSVEEVVGSAIRAARPALGDMTVRTALAPNLPLVEFDAVLIERVLVNLLENAAKYGAPPVVVSAQVTPDALVLCVRDHGAGLPAALAGREQTLFYKFTRGESESATPGVGLGLAICKAVVEAHGGAITAANAPADADGGGAQFTMTLPRQEPPPAETVE